MTEETKQQKEDEMIKLLQKILEELKEIQSTLQIKFNG